MQTLQLKIAQNSVAYVRFVWQPDTVRDMVELGYGLVEVGYGWVRLGATV